MNYVISAIVSIFNSDSFIVGCLDDLLSQTMYNNNQLEIILVNSGSEQGEESIIYNYQKKYRHIKYVRTERETLYAAWNRGINLANGKYLTNANTDDRHRHDALEIMSTWLDEHPDADLVYGDCYVSTTSNETFAENTKKHLYRYPRFSPPDSLLHYQFGPQPMWRKQVHEKIGFFDGNFKAAGDYDFNIRFALKCKALHIPHPLGLYLEHGDALSFKDNTAVLENYHIKEKYRTTDCIEKLYRQTGVPADTNEEKANIYLDMGIRSLEFYPPWSLGKAEADIDFALQCLQKASILLPVWPPQSAMCSSSLIAQGNVTTRSLYETFTGKFAAVSKNETSIRSDNLMNETKPNTGLTFPFSTLAHTYCVGKGLEIGGSAHNPFGLNTRNVDYCDSMDTIYKQEEVRLCGRAMPVDIVALGDAIPLPDESQDFVVSSHVLEHFPNPIKALKEWYRLVKPGGIIFMIVPHKDRTFDNVQPRTTLQHLVEDFYHDATEPHENPQGHDHCWITEDIVELVNWMATHLGIRWKLVDVQDVDDKVGNGFTIVLKKDDALPLSTESTPAASGFAPKSVLYVVHGFPPAAVGGVEVYTRNLAREMQSRSVQVTVLYPVVDAREPLNSFSTTIAEGLTTVRFNVQRGSLFSSITSPDLDAAFAGFLREHAFDVVHFQHVYENLSLSMIAVAKKAAIPVALTLHDFWFICPRAQLFIEETDSVCTGPETPAKCAACIYRTCWYPTTSQAVIEETIALRHSYVRDLLKGVDLLLAPSQFVRDIFQRYGFGDGAIVLSPLGIGAFAPVSHRPSDTLRFGFLGTIHPVKNIMRLVAAFGTTRGNARLHIYGGGEDSRVKTLVDGIHDPRVSYHGAYTSEQLPEILAGMDALVVPSLIESYCFTAREAISAGLPVLAANVGGIPEVISHGRNGILFDPRQTVELAGLLQSIIDTPHILQRFTATPAIVPTIQEDASSLLDRYRTMRDMKAEAKCQGSEQEIGAAAKPARHRDDRMLEIAVFSLDYPEHACGYYRLSSPLKALSQSLSFGWGISLRGKDVQIRPEVLTTADVIVIQRFFPRKETQAFIDHLFTLNKPIIYEVDDFLTNIPDSNPNHAVGNPNAAYIHGLVRRCTAVSVSTGELKRHFEQYNENIFVLPNLLDDGLWQTPSPDSGARPLVVSYTGTITHATDIALLEEVLERIAAAHPGEVSFTFMGCATERLSRLPGFTFIPFETTYETYARKLQQIPIDIALVPLEDNPFNRCKSNVKWLEYSACGVAGIYADLTPYNTTIEHGNTGLLVGNDPQQWFNAIDLLIKNPELRRSIAANARRKVLSEYTLKTGARCWLDAYRQVIASHGEKLQRNVPHTEAASHEAIAKPGPSALVSIVIPLFNRVDLTRRCLEALSQTVGASVPHEIILVDNGSTDATEEYLRLLGNNVVIIRNSDNLGFAKACNQGARAASGKYLLFLNNDTVPQPDWLEPLIKVLEDDSSVAAAGSKLLYPDGTIQHAGVMMVDNRAGNDPLCGEHIWRGRPGDLPEANQPYRYQALTAACLLVRRTAFEVVQGFDEGYWNGYEDVDLCFKLGRQGWKLVYQPQSVVIHHESKSGPERFSRVAGNIERLHRTWLGRITPDMVIQAGGRVEQTGSAIGPYGGEGARPAPIVSIIVPLYNQAQLTKACVEAVRATAGDPERYELILVDNDSRDWTREYVKSLGDSVTVITNSDNLGFARACNQGAQVAKGKYLLFLNNDTVPRAGWLEALLAGAEEDGADIVGGKLLYPNGRVQHAGVAFNKNGIGYHIFRNFPADAPAVNKKRLMQCVTAACLLVSRQLFIELGGFDEHFHNGFEDVDFCLRAGQSGRRVLYTPHAVVVHHEEQSEGRKQFDARNMQRYLARWQGKVRCDDEELYDAEGFSVQWHADGSCTVRQRNSETARTAGRYPLVPLVGSYAETPLARLSASPRMKALLKAYSGGSGVRDVPTL